MIKNNRHDIIIREVRIHNRVLLNDLAILLNVSIDTVRRDIIELDQEKKLKRIHGGAQAKGYQPFNYTNNEVYSHEQKITIANKAAKLVHPNSISLISGGTSNLELVRVLPKDIKATFFTPSLPIAMQLLEHKSIEVVFLGGRLSKSSQIALGGSVLNALAEIKFDNCFLGTSYLDIGNGLTESDWEVVQLKKAMIRSSNRIISLAISEKLGTVQRYKICDIENINTLITELSPKDSKLNPYHNLGLQIL